MTNERDATLRPPSVEEKDRMPPASGEGSAEPKAKDEVVVKDPKTAPVDADVEAHKKLDQSSGE